MDWFRDGHTILAKYDDRSCTAIMVINCNSRNCEEDGSGTCHVADSSYLYGWEVFAGYGDFDLTGVPLPIEWQYFAPEEIKLRVVKED